MTNLAEHGNTQGNSNQTMDQTMDQTIELTGKGIVKNILRGFWPIAGHGYADRLNQHWIKQLNTPSKGEEITVGGI
jgi:hypothetical protein